MLLSPIRPREALPFKAGKEARLRVNLEPLGLSSSRRQALAFRPGSRKVHLGGNSPLDEKTINLIPYLIQVRGKFTQMARYCQPWRQAQAAFLLKSFSEHARIIGACGIKSGTRIVAKDEILCYENSTIDSRVFQKKGIMSHTEA